MLIREITAAVTLVIAVLGFTWKLIQNWEDRVVTDALFKKKLIKVIQELEPNEGKSLVDRVEQMKKDIEWIKSKLGDDEQ